MERSIANIFGLVIAYILALLPIFGFLTYSAINKAPQVLLIYLSVLSILLILFERGNINIPKYLLYYGLFVLYTTMSDVFVVGVPFDEGYVRNNRYLGSFLLLLIIENTIFNKHFNARIIKIMVATVVVTFLVILIQEFYNREFMVMRAFNIDGGLNHDRLVSVYSWIDNRMAFGTVFFPMFFFVLEIAFKKENNKVVALLYVIGITIAFLNRSRITMVQFLASFLLIAIYQGVSIKTFSKYLLLFSAVIALGYVGFKQLNVNVDEIVQERILDSDARSLETSSAGGRILAFAIFAETFPKHPFFGKGKFFKSGHGEDVELLRLLAGRSYQIHVGYLALLYYYGLVGGGFYLLFVLAMARKLFHDARQTTYWAPFLAWLLYMLNNFTDVFIHFDFMGILVVLILNTYLLQKLNEEKEEPAYMKSREKARAMPRQQGMSNPT